MVSASLMSNSSDYPNVLSSRKVRMTDGDRRSRSSYHPNMPRKAKQSTVIGPDWFLQEWMRYFKKSQADMCRLTGWSKATMSDIYNGTTNYYREILNEVARALEVSPFELLMHPDEAHALRRLRDSALTIAADSRQTFTPPAAVQGSQRKAG